MHPHNTTNRHDQCIGQYDIGYILYHANVEQQLITIYDCKLTI